MGYLTGLPLPEPHVDYDAFWEGCRHHTLLIQCCKACKRYRHYPRPVCPACQSRHSEWKTVSGKGQVWSYTIVREPMDPAVSDQAPYNIVEIELAEQRGLRLISNLMDCPVEDIYIGMPVKVVFERTSPEIILPRFTPDFSRSAT